MDCPRQNGMPWANRAEGTTKALLPLLALEKNASASELH